ncbi:MAG: glycosyltransferase family 2 protein [Lentisphaeraceae bacterium]|nr:glycosyltransferase family 2 protein [Lentisphaeraceae bacterium]
MKTTVCIATYNGMKWLDMQVKSIIDQSTPVDEWVIIDDCSIDGTLNYLRQLPVNGKVLIENKQNIGVVKSFEKALANATGDVIFLCDQDDIWMPDKVERVLNRFKGNDNLSLVVHDALLIDENNNEIGNSFFAARSFKTSFLSNIYKNSFHGCCMAIRTNCLGRAKILPFPEEIPMHDWWIGICLTSKQIAFIPEALLAYRKHKDNLTGERSSVSEIFSWRLRLILNLFVRILKRN